MRNCTAPFWRRLRAMWRNPRIYIDGADGLGWSIDADRANMLRLARSVHGCTVVDDPRKADIIHNLWWNNVRTNAGRKRLLVTCSNFVNPASSYFSLHRELIYAARQAFGWICPSSRQQVALQKLGLRTYYMPFFVDTQLFAPSRAPDRRTACEKLGIDFHRLEGRCVIGSFQRDSLGTDLSQAKWQKNPDLLVELLAGLPKDQFVLLLAGPRRHYILKRCRERGIPYVYVGRETLDDDVGFNAVSLCDMPFLYHLTDLYLVVSKSEGGPKAVIEAASTRTFVMSTDVGLARDFIDASCVFSDEEAYGQAVRAFVTGRMSQPWRDAVVEANYGRCMELESLSAMSDRLSAIYMDTYNENSYPV